MNIVVVMLLVCMVLLQVMILVLLWVLRTRQGLVPLTQRTWGRTPYRFGDLDISLTVAALQEVQRLICRNRLAASGEATLTDITRLVQVIQQQFGAGASVEDIIQQLVTLHAEQLMNEQRKAASQFQRPARNWRGRANIGESLA